MPLLPRQYTYITYTFSPIESERQRLLMLERNKFVFTSTKGTQTEPETFYVNGKPARAVKPFRILLNQGDPPAVVPAQPPQLEMLEEENAAGWAQVQWVPEQQLEEQEAEEQQLGMHQAEAQPLEVLQAGAQTLEIEQTGAQPLEMERAEAEPLGMQQLERQLSEMQETQELEEELEVSELQEPQLQEPEQQQWPQSHQLHSQETQTELQDLHRQLLLLKKEEPAAAVATREE